MNKVLEFVIENKELIADAVAIVVAIVLFIIKKKPIKVLSTIKELGLRLLPFLINDAEKTELKGEDKKDYVFAHLIQAFVDEGYDPKLIEQDSKYWFNEIEVILSTPQKKGEK